jgi:AcrR family transcriptional regulator
MPVLRADTERVTQILTSATELFRKNGYHGTSMRDIGEATGMNKGNIYYYFENKEAILFHLVHSTIQEMVRGLRAIESMAIPARARLELAVQHHIRFSTERQGVLALLVTETRFLGEARRSQIMEVANEYKGLLKRIFHQGMRGGEFRQLDPSLATLAILGMCNWMYSWYSPDGARTPDEIGHEFTRLLMEPIGPPTDPT